MKLALFVVLALLGLAASKKSYEGYKVYRFSTTEESDLKFLETLKTSRHYDFWTPVNKVGKPISMMTSPEGQESIEKWFNLKKISYEIVNENVEKTLQQETEKLQTRKSFNGRIEFDQYYRHAEINAYLDEIAANYPEIATLQNIGQSYEGRDMNLLRISTGAGSTQKPVIFVDAGIHAREWIAPAVALYLINQLVEVEDNRNLIENVDWIILPSVNPDGYEFTWDEDRMWRKTLSPGVLCDGCDPNRNFGYHWMESGADDFECSEIYAGKSAFSEVEARNLRDYLATLENVRSYHTLHSCGEYLLWPWGYGPVLADNAEELDNVGNLIRDAIYAVQGTDYLVGNSAIALYPAAGASDDWAKSLDVDIVFTQELPCGDSSQGFGMDPSRILSVDIETFEGFKVLHKYIEDNFANK